jgi:membrane associated rhomboid family serine protease
VFPVTDNIPTTRFPFATAGLILANALAYALVSLHGGSLISGPDAHEVVRYGMMPDRLTHHGAGCGVSCGSLPAWETVFTSMFVHVSIVQLAGDLLFLWIFGATVEASIGPIRYLLLYLLSGIAAIALQLVLEPHSTALTLGAAGAIAGVLGGYIVLHPRARVLTVVLILSFTVLELPALALLGVWFAEQAAFAATDLTTPQGGGSVVAYVADAGGFILGMTMIGLLARRTRVPPTPTLAP